MKRFLKVAAATAVASVVTSIAMVAPVSAEYPEKPVNFIWGCTDDVFTEAWGRTWAERMKASFDPIADAGHFLQNTHGAEVARLILERA